MPEAKVLVVSTSVDAGTREDRGGPAVAGALATAGWGVLETRVVPDGVEPVAAALTEMAEDFVGLIATTGGTGFAPSDLTPEATRSVIDREAPGLAEAMRSVDPRGRLGRGICGTFDRALIVNCPGSPGGAVDQLNAVLDVLPHAISLLSDTPSQH